LVHQVKKGKHQVGPRGHVKTSFLVPVMLYEQVEEKMKVFGYMSVSEVCRELLRKWVNE